MNKGLKKISGYEWQIPKKKPMLVPAKLYVSEKLLKLVEDNAINQLKNVATLQGIQKYALAMPDIHSG